VEGQYAGIPANEIILENAPAKKTSHQASNFSTPPPKSFMQEFVVPLSDGTRAIFQWPASLTKEDVDDLKDSLKILERKITRPAPSPTKTDEATE
jgi:hypothetical protein